MISINVGCKVKVYDYEFEEEMELKIVGSTEANSLEGKISNESPVGKALIGAHTGDVVEVEMPSGIMKYKVLEIQRNVYNKSDKDIEGGQHSGRAEEAGHKPAA